MRPSVSIALLLLATYGCEKSTSGQGDLPQWSINERPTLDIGDDDAGTTESAGDANGVTRSPEGGVIVADRQSSSIKFFSADGTLIKQVGRAGRGPGEFARLSHLMRCGDSLFVFDNGRYSVLSLDGVTHRQFVVAGPAAGDRPYRTACNSRGVLLSYAWDRLQDLPPTSGVTRTLVPYWLSGADGALIASLGQFGSSERWATVTSGISGTGPLPLGKQPVIAVGQSSAYIGLADSFAIDVYSLDGRRTGRIRRDQPVRRPTPADIERFKLMDTIGRLATDNIRTVEEWKQMQFAQTLPAYSAMIVDAHDNLWVKIFPSNRETRATWVGFTPTGLPLAQLTLPRDLDVSEISSSDVLGTETDLQSGIKRVKRYELIRPRERRPVQ